MIFKTKHLPRYKDIIRLLWRHGRAPAFRQLAEATELQDDQALPVDDKSPAPEALVNDLEKMGPTFVKLGQLLSSRADLLPEPYMHALARLQDKVEPFPYAEVEEIVQTELGVRISKAFQEFDPKPIAAASLGQVHRAVLRDGREVAVKVQRPNIRKQIAEDLEVLEEVAMFLEAHTQLGRQHRFVATVDEMKRALTQELDYQREATNLATLGRNMEEFPHIRVVQPINDYTSRGVLTMTYLSGCKITDLSSVAHLDFDGAALAEELFRAYLKQILVDGFFHADPHPGNVFLTADGCVGLLDLGMVGRVTPGMQESLIKLLLAVSEGRAEDAASVAIKISETTDEFDETTFRRRIGELVLEMQDNTLRKMDIGRALLEVSRAAGETGLFAPAELTMLGKTLLQLDQIGRSLDSEFNPNASIRRNVTEILGRRVGKGLTPGNLLGSLLDVKDFVQELPSRVNKVLDIAGKGEIKLKLRREDTLNLLDGFQKVANRIAAGVVLGALIVGAALMMRIDTEFKIFGYPGLAIICFIFAVIGAVWLLFDMFIRDTKRPPGPPS